MGANTKSFNSTKGEMKTMTANQVTSPCTPEP